MEQIFFFSEEYLNRDFSRTPNNLNTKDQSFSLPRDCNDPDESENQTQKSEKSEKKKLYYASAHFYCCYNVKNFSTVYEDISNLKLLSKFIKVWIDQRNKAISISMLFEQSINIHEILRYINESLWNMDLFIDQVLLDFPKYLVFQKNIISPRITNNNYVNVNVNDTDGKDDMDEISFDTLVRLCFELKRF
jgi:hypothetical protein